MAVAGAALGEATEIVINIKPGHREAAPAPATQPLGNEEQPVDVGAGKTFLGGDADRDRD